ncbi:MAG TPA: DUF4019 domain-containing protein [Pyrinomonadaceae bacterium]|nr:DUF4019 domain-containing protein [Pyrinomonadaceae bacterium]
MREKGTGEREGGKARAGLLPFAFCLLPFAFLAACGGGEERRGDIPAEAQAAVERLSEDIAEGRFTRVYEEAAEEWRRDVTLEESEELLRRVRERLGRVESRTRRGAREQQYASGPLPGHTLELTYETTFERGSAVELLALVRRDGRWQLARYRVSSEALKQ